MNHNSIAERRLFELLDDRPKSVSDLAVAVRKVVSSQAKGCSELLYCGYAVSNAFSYTAKLGQGFIHIATYTNHVNLGFNQGVELDDPNEILKGTGKSIRHIRVNELKDVKTPAAKDLIRQAIELGQQLAEKAGGKAPQTFLDKSKKT